MESRLLCFAWSPVSFPDPRTSICNNAPRAGSSSPPRLCRRTGLELGPTRGTAHSFFGRFGSPSMGVESPSNRGGRHSMSTALRAPEMTPIGAGAYRSLGHSAWLTPWVMAGENMFRAAHEGRESARGAPTPPLLAADPPANELFAVKNMSPEKMLAISGADRFSRRGGTCRLHAIFMNQS
jgi:hypothetical protein